MGFGVWGLGFSAQGFAAFSLESWGARVVKESGGEGQPAGVHSSRSRRPLQPTIAHWDLRVRFSVEPAT